MSLLNTIGGPGSAWNAMKVKAKAFDHADSNGDASLDKAELQKVFDTVAAKTGRTARDAEAVIAKADQDGDGALTRLEIRASLRDLRPAPASTVALARREGDTTR